MGTKRAKPVAQAGRCLGRARRREAGHRLAPDEVFGPRREECCVTRPLRGVPPAFRRVGAEAQFENDRGEQMTLVVTEIEDNQITLDGKYPPAGHLLVYRLRVESVELSPAH